MTNSCVYAENVFSHCTICNLKNKVMFDCFFFRERYLLSPNRGSTYLEVTNSAIDNYKLTNDRERLDSVVTMFISSLQNLANSLCYLKQTI